MAGADINGTSVANIGTVALTNVGGTATFTGSVSGTAVTADNTVVNLALTGTGNGGTITNAVVFDQHGNAGPGAGSGHADL